MLPLRIHAALLIIVGLLTFATLTVAWLKRINPQKNYIELVLRIRTWWWIVALFTIAIISYKWVALTLMGMVCFLALKEFLSLTPTRHSDHTTFLWAYLTIPIQLYWVWSDWYGMFIIFIPVYAFLFLPMHMVLRGETKGFLRAVSTLHWALMTTVFSLSHLAFLLVMPPKAMADHTLLGAELLFFVAVLTQLNDVAQFLWGKALGKRKIVPLVSPNKTWAGFAGGVATTTLLASLLAPWFTPLTGWQGPVAGLIIGCAGFIGDIVMSAVKRDIGVKDTGNLLPGHGGILDRLDSLTFTAPLFFHFVRYLHY